MSAVEPRRLRIERRRTSTSRRNPSPIFATVAVVDAEVQRRLSWHRCSKKGAERDQCDVECGGATRVAPVVLASQRRRAEGRSGPQGAPPACRRPALEVRPGPRGRSVASGPAARKYAARAAESTGDRFREHGSEVCCLKGGLRTLQAATQPMALVASLKWQGLLAARIRNLRAHFEKPKKGLRRCVV